MAFGGNPFSLVARREFSVGFRKIRRAKGGPIDPLRRRGFAGPISNRDDPADRRRQIVSESGGGILERDESDRDTPSSLADFLVRIHRGDEAAARELLSRYEAEVRLVVRRQLPRLLRSRFDSLDFLQSVWGSFFRRMRDAPTEFEDSRHLVAFLARAAKNKVIDEYRRAASRKHREEPLWSDGRHPQDLADSIDSPSEVAQAHEAYGRLMGLLPEERQSILKLKAGGLSSKDIGEQLGISERTVQRVLEDLRRRVESEWEQRG